MGCASANGSIPLAPIPAASVVVAIQTAMRSFRVFNDASTARAVPRITAVMLFPKVEMML
jgi:hypothetical protein